MAGRLAIRPRGHFSGGLGNPIPGRLVRPPGIGYRFRNEKRIKYIFIPE